MKLPGLQYESPVKFSGKQRFQLAVLPPLIAAVMKMLNGLNKIEIRDGHHLEHTLEVYGHVVLGVWHESTGTLASVFQGRNFHSTASYSFDGQLAARIISHFGCESVRGSSSRGGSEALRELCKAAALVPCVALTMDGPRGPRRVAKPGIAILAARTQLPIVTACAALTRRKRLRSWDRFPVPLPFGRIVVGYTPPIPPPRDDSPEEVERVRLQVEATLNQHMSALEQELGDHPDH